ncbi:MAG: hypothetical protein FJ318_01835 [SAR202 cluster bacterium]|nr:hypothetical protein [SAR202 cluster bacterium]
MKFPIGVGLNRDPRYPGHFGIPSDIVNVPQTVPQWWAVVFILALVILPFGVWGALTDTTRVNGLIHGGTVLTVAYFVYVALTGIAGWIIRHEKFEEMPQIFFSIVIALVTIAVNVWLIVFRTFGDGQWFAGSIAVAQTLFAINILYRSWQIALVIGLFTTQPRRLDTVGSTR